MKIKPTHTNLLYIGIALEIIILIISYFETDNSTSFFQSAARYSGRISLLYFSMLFLYIPLPNSILKITKTDNLKVGLFSWFAILHVIHFSFLATYLWLSGFELDFVRLAGGILAYLFIVAMPLLFLYSNLTSKTLNIFEQVYLYYV